MASGQSSSATSRTPRSYVSALDIDYVDESHMKAFAEALKADEFSGPLDDLASPASPMIGPSTSFGHRVRKVSALSDFAPVNTRVRRRKKANSNRGADGRRQEWLFILVRWPLLEWKDAALALDEYLHFDEWKTIDEDSYYDWKLVRKVLRTLKNLRAKNDAHGLLGVLETCIRTNFAGVESPRLYSETFYGTKDLIEAYVNEQERAIEFIRNSPDISNEEKKRFFKNANTNLGTTALCLSGGATFGYYHFGVVKAFLDADLLPRVISGTSAGGLVAALVCTRTNEELKQLLVPELANRITACEDPFGVWFQRFWKTGARFDSVEWAKKATFFTRGSMTFREAYMRTGRILNVSVIPADRHSPTKLLNYLNAPDTVIWSALLASAAYQDMNPVVLMQKLRDVSQSLLQCYTSGRFSSNPHVHLFFFAPRGSAGKPVASRKQKGWRGNFLLSAAEQWLKLELTKNFKVIRDLDLLPTILGQDWSSVFLQRFDGTVTIWPRTRFKDWINILSDPDVPELERMMRVGQLVTWPKLHIIENRYRLERQIFMGRQAIRKAMRSRAQERIDQAAEAQPQGRVPTPITDTKLTMPQLSLSQSQDSPVPLDTDTEDAYKAGRSGRSSRHHSNRNSHVPQSPHFIRSANGSNQDVRRALAARRVWPTSGSADGDSGDDIPPVDYGRASPDPPPERDEEGKRDSHEQLQPAPAQQQPTQPSSQPHSSSACGLHRSPHSRLSDSVARMLWAATADRSDSLSQEEEVDDGEGQDQDR
ncbi:hypothetical protein BC629DRAFT_1726055 [Irpex lacteus]|nr:hypothetical protein BC629DRAFT_1726055 [Irpex lacteus]